ncbi:hypothetical protein [Parabacteroides sp. FAFU027]|uniref:hypothetical protein n=1 Tax=Parabacteroides sp. FAFU027 TaxID=2922715 RepID=UPI001FAFE0F5|nr:hypothetical protein [Parabacteroides sp. FAFU027]
MPKQGYAEQVSKNELMLSGLKNNAGKLSRRGIDEAFISQYETDHKATIALNNEQERLKAELKLKTSELEARLEKVKAATSEASKLVKMDIPQEQWKEFGITVSK